MPIKYLFTSPEHLEQSKSLERRPSHSADSPHLRLRIQNHLVVCDAVSGKVYENVTHIADGPDLPGYEWQDAKVIGQVEKNKLIRFEDYAGCISPEKVFRTMKYLALNGEERERVKKAFDDRYPVLGHPSKDSFHVTDRSGYSGRH